MLTAVYTVKKLILVFVQHFVKLQSFLVAALFFVAFSIVAEEAPTELPKLDNRASDVRVIVDISGSMKQTDPNNLRQSALNMLVEMLPEGSRAGVWTFGKYVNMLVPLGEVDQAWRDKTKAAIEKINSVGLLTNLPEALDRATWQLEADGDYKQSIILLTDGKVDMALPSDKNRDEINQKERDRLLTQVLNKYREAGAKIHTLGLSDGVDKDLLQQMALETDGLFSEAKSADELLKAFLKLFDQAVPAEQVPMEDNTFVIDESVNEFTALIFRKSNKPSQLLAPNGDAYNADNADQFEHVRWYKDIAFDLITVTKPEAGTWIAEADLDDNNRVTIMSDMSLSVAGFPATIFAGDKIDLAIALQNAGETITKPELLRLTDVSVKVIAADGREGTKLLSNPETVPEDGVYHEIFTRLSEEGQYQIEVTAESKTFSRKQTIFSNLIQPVEIETRGEPKQFQILVKALSENLDLERSRVIAKVQAPGESAIIQSIAFDEKENAWLLTITDKQGIGEYSVELNVRGVTQSGRTFKVKPDAIVFSLPYQAAEQMAEPEMLELPELPAEPEMKAEENIEPEQMTEQAVDQQPVMEEPASEEMESIVPDLAAKHAEQEKVMSEAEVEAAIEEDEALEDEEAIEEDDEFADEESAEEEPADDGMPWWIYVILAVVNLAVVGAGIWYFFIKKKQDQDDDFDHEELSPLLEDDLDENDPELNEELGDFGESGSEDEELISSDDESFDSATPEEAPELATEASDPEPGLAEEIPVVEDTPEPEEDEGPGMVSTNESEPETDTEELGDDFAIDSETEQAAEESDDDWGEFDTDLEDAIDEKTESDQDSSDEEGEEKN